MEEDEIKSQFLLSGYDNSPEEITKILGIQPTKVARKGEVRRADPSGVHPPILHKENLWILKSDFPNTASVEDHIKYILAKLRPKAKEITELTAKYYGELSVYGFAYDSDRQALHIARDVVNGLAEFNISLDVDIYPLVDGHLDTSEKIEKLTKRLKKLKSVVAYQTGDHNEANSIAETLAVFERCGSAITDLTSDLFWEALNERDLEARLAQVAQNIQKIQQAANKSKILSLE